MMPSFILEKMRHQTNGDSGPDLASESPEYSGNAAGNTQSPETGEDSGSQNAWTAIRARLRSLTDSKKKRVVWISGAVAVVLLVAGGVVLGTQLRVQAEERAAAVEEFELTSAKHLTAVNNLNNNIQTADYVLSDVSDDEVMEVRVLKDLASLTDEAKKMLAEYEAGNTLPLDDASNEQIEAATYELTESKAFMDRASVILLKQIESVNESVRLKEEADAEAALAAKQAADEAARQTQKTAAQPISFVDLARAGDSLRGNYYRFEGRVIQDAGSSTYRVSITRTPGFSRDFWEDPILVTVLGDTAQRVLQDDVISFVGMSAGITSYGSVLGQTIQVPAVVAEGGDVAVIGRAE